MNGYELRELDDSELVAEHKAGNPEAFGVLFERYQDRMWAVALRTTQDPEIAADAVQDGFMAAFRRIESFRGDSQFSTWMHRIVVNACVDRLRRIRPTQEWPEYDIADERDIHAVSDTRITVQEALAKLPEPQRLAIALVDMEGFSISEAAAALTVAEGTVKSRCSRGRTALAVMLGVT